MTTMSTLDRVTVVLPPELTDHPIRPIADVLGAGLRAQWIAAALTSPAAEALTPREREVLMIVAIHPHGAVAAEGVRSLRRSGMSQSASHHLLQRLAGAGWLSCRQDGHEPHLDLPEEDRAWISARVRELIATTASTAAPPQGPAPATP